MNNHEHDMLLDIITTKNCVHYNSCINSIMNFEEEESCLCPLYARSCEVVNTNSKISILRKDVTTEPDHHFVINRLGSIYTGVKIGRYKDIQFYLTGTTRTRNKDFVQHALDMYILIFGKDHLFDSIL